MERLRTAVIGICMLSAAVGMIGLIRPGKLDRQIRFLVSMLFLLALGQGLLQMELPEDWETLTHAEYHTAALSAEAEAQLLAQTRHLAESALTERLEEAGVHCTSLSVTVHMDGAGCISISEARAECDDFAAACRILEEALGEEVNIVVTEVLV